VGRVHGRRYRSLRRDCLVAHAITKRLPPGTEVSTTKGCVLYKAWCETLAARLNKGKLYRVDTDKAGGVAVVCDMTLPTQRS